ncbi:MAG: aspartate aminotransferase family protein [Anaerolineae bacterium]|nr:aspartate aminotransferase family protein [Anaerolineae bacterium]
MQELVKHVMVDFVQMSEFSQQPFIIERGDGIRLYDVDGKAYIDGLSGVFVVGTGHNNPAIVNALRDQLEVLSFAPPLHSTNPPALKLARLVLDQVPAHYSVVKFYSGGSEATEGALKMARQFHRQTGHPLKYKIISFYQGYHGGTLGALSATGMPNRRWVFEPLVPGFLHVLPPNLYRPPMGLAPEAWEEACVRQFEEVIQGEHPDTVAAIILEPILMSAGVLVPSPKFFQTLREICDKYNVLLIFDEIITGWGRLGEWFAAEAFGVWPDLLCVGKGMSAGYSPLAGVIVSDKVGQAFWGEPSDNVQFHAGHTYGGNPLSCAAGLANVGYMIEHRVVDNAREVGAYLGEQLRALADRFECIGDVRGKGMLWGVEFVQDRATRASFPASANFGKRVELAARARGLVIRGAPNFITFAPPLVCTREDIDQIVGIVSDSIAYVLDHQS